MKHNQIRFTLLTSVLLAFAVLFTHSTTWAETKRFIEVSAQSQVEVDPDVVDLRFTLSAKQKTPKLAVKAIRAKEKQALAALKKAGMKLRDVQISYLSLYPNFVYKRILGRSTRVLDGYKASKTFVACIRNIRKMAHFVEALAGANVTSFSTAFRSTKVETHRKKLRKMAVEAAKAKANELAKHAGVKLGAVKFIQENQGGGRYWGSSNRFAYSRKSSSRGARPGAVTMRLRIRMSFYLK